MKPYPMFGELKLVLYFRGILALFGVFFLFLGR